MIKERVIAGLLLVSLAIALQLFIGDIRGIWFDFALAALISLSFLLNFFEILFLVLFAAYILNWQPGMSFELLVFAALPIGSFLLRKFLPFEPWIGNMVLSFFGVAIFYSLFGIHIIMHTPALFFADIAASIVCSVAVFKTMVSFFPAEDLDF